MQITRRHLIQTASIALTAPYLSRAAVAQGAGRFVVVGRDFCGATAARFLAAAGHAVTLVERHAQYVACPFRNTVLAGTNTIDAMTFGYDGLVSAGVTVLPGEAVGADSGQLTLPSSDVLDYDRLVLSPGIDMRFEPLRQQRAAMEDGGTVAIVVPENLFRCPPGTYERASLLAHYLTQSKPRSKILILDAKDALSKRPLFEWAWAALYPGMIEWVPMSMGGRVISVDSGAMTVSTDFDTISAAVANVIPPQMAGSIAVAASVADATGWCPVHPDTFESTLIPGIHALGDAALAGAMPKSAFAANAQGKVVAAASDALLRGNEPQVPILINTCYSLAAPRLCLQRRRFLSARRAYTGRSRRRA